MKKNILIYISIIVVAIALGISLFFILNPNKKDKNIQIFVDSLDGKERFVIYEGPKLDYYNNGEIRSLYEPSASFYPEMSEDDFIKDYVLNNEYYKNNVEYIWPDGTKEILYEFIYNDYSFYLEITEDSLSPSVAIYPYIVSLYPENFFGYSETENKNIIAIAPFNIWPESISENKYSAISYEDIGGINNYDELFNWYKELNNPYVSLNEKTKEIKIQALGQFSKEYLSNTYFIFTPNDKITVLVEE